MRDPEPCRMKHTEEQTGWCLSPIYTSASDLRRSYLPQVPLSKRYLT